jgi:Hypoxia induced protein conserved region
MMSTVLVILIVLAAIAALISLIRGIVAFLQTTEAELKSGATGPSISSQKQNKMMFARVGFQAVAVILCVLLLALNR